MLHSVPCLAVVAVVAFAGLAGAADVNRGAFVEFHGPVRGNITFNQIGEGPVTIFGNLTGLTPGRHGFHIHENGDVSTGCAAAGGHFNPTNKKHGAPFDSERHVGDLGNILANEYGFAQVRMEDKIISLTGPNGILNRAVVIHANEDDLGKGGFSDSLTTGHAGERVACGTIKIKFPPGPWGMSVNAHGGASALRWSWTSSWTLLACVLAWISRNTSAANL